MFPTVPHKKYLILQWYVMCVTRRYLTLQNHMCTISATGQWSAAICGVQQPCVAPLARAYLHTDQGAAQKQGV